MEKKQSIVIVDDDESLLDALRESCVMEGYVCATHTRAETAAGEIERNPYDVLLTDIVMPGMKGLELASRAKQLRPGMIIIVMTGFIGDFSYDEVIRAGASDFIKKPFTIQELQMRIRHARMQERLRELSFTDELTGLPNRRGFFAFAQHQMKMVNRAGGKMALLFADLDDFKSINDTRGHLEGDAALVDAANVFRETFRDSDIIARMSGDEFAILLIDARETSLAGVTERLQKQIDAFNARTGGLRRLSVSIGMAVYDPRQPCTIDELLKQADDRMYAQKQRKKSAGPASSPA